VGPFTFWRIVVQVNLVSDLHLNFADATLPGGDILLLAGDVFEAGYLRLADNAGKHTHIADRYRRFASRELTKYNTVLYVFGNHEYYKHDFATTRDRIEAILPDNVVVLDNNYVQLDGVLFWGATMWTDHNRGNPVARQACQEAMSDYRVIKHDPAILQQGLECSYYTNKFSADQSEQIHQTSRNKLREFLATYPTHKTVIITHHAPHYESISAEYRSHVHGYVNHAYYSDFGDLILDNPQIKLWAHGHVHCMNDYEIGSCRVVSNPRGYVGYEAQSERWEVAKFANIEI
jgi:Icc-related predicted phosphoesterase